MRASAPNSTSVCGDLLRYNLSTVRAYLLKEAFQQLWEYDSPAWAGKFLDEWCRQTMRSRIEPMKKIARSLRNHRDLILNYFRAHKMLSSGVVEGLNNKAKITMRKSYGFRTYRVLELALYHSLGKLPEPSPPTIFSDEPLTITFTTAAFDRSSLWQFEASPYRATSKGPPSSFVQHDACASS